MDWIVEAALGLIVAFLLFPDFPKNPPGMYDFDHYGEINKP